MYLESFDKNLKQLQYTTYKSVKELEKLALLETNLMELRFQNTLLEILDSVFLKEIKNEIKNPVIKHDWSSSDKLDRLKQLHVILSLASSKRIFLA